MTEAEGVAVEKGTRLVCQCCGGRMVVHAVTPRYAKDGTEIRPELRVVNVVAVGGAHDGAGFVGLLPVLWARENVRLVEAWEG